MTRRRQRQQLELAKRLYRAGESYAAIGRALGQGARAITRRWGWRHPGSVWRRRRESIMERVRRYWLAKDVAA